MRKLWFLLALLVVSSISANAQTTCTIAFITNRVPLVGCDGLGETITKNVTTTVTTASGEATAFQTAAGANSAFRPAYNPEYYSGFVGCTEATLGLPGGAFAGRTFPDGRTFSGPPTFDGEGMLMHGWSYTPGANSNFPTANYFTPVTFETRDGIWTGSATIWFQSYKCGRFNRATCFQPVGGSGSITTTMQ
jgi:hypothetical protein